VIAEAAGDQAEALAAIHAEAFDHPWDAASFSALLGSPGVLALAEAAGFILIRAVADEAEVLTLAVRPGARRRGLARRLLQAAEDHIIRRGVESLFLEVAADNHPALALYRDAGFEPSGRRAGYYARTDGAAVDALVLKKRLRPPA
jgi:ribosomal-protein-alanine N-acetyltransferase